ncbi:MAG TPA: ABC transporter permease [Clostridiales bacterium]|nr:ABC transporter permease [Clostridiales bacterium]
MALLEILKKEFKHNLREKRGNIMMVLFPILLMLILGTALSGMFESNITFDDAKVLYSIEDEGNITEAFKSFMQQGENLGIGFEETENLNDGIEKIKNAGFSCFIIVNNEDSVLRFYKNDRYNFEANFVESILQVFVGRYNAIMEVAKENPAYLGTILSQDNIAIQQESKGFSTVKTLDRTRQPRAIDHYAVVMLTMILMYSSLTGFWSIKNEQNLKTGNRLLCARVQKHEILLGKVLGSIIATLVQAFIVIFFSKFALKAYWGQHIGIVILIIISEAIMAISIGTGIAFAIKNETISIGILNTIIPIMVFLGGGYIPLQVFRKTLLNLSAISPIRWINQSIFRVIYNNDFSLVPLTVTMNFTLAAVFIILSSLLYRKESVK